MNFDESEVKVLKLIVVAVSVITISIASSYQMTKYQLRMAIEAGGAPMEVACAFRSW